jgi:hypothetical protein
MVEVLRCKPEGSMFDSRWRYWYFSLTNHSGRTMALVSTRLPNEYREYLLGSKGGRCLGLRSLPPSCANSLEIWEPQRPGALRTCPVLYTGSLTFGKETHKELKQTHRS